MRTSAASRGLALIVVVGVLGVLAVLAAAFVTMAQLERRASQQRTNAAKAYLLARSGIEDALTRLALGQDATYGGENWDGSSDGLLSGYEGDQEVYRKTGTGTLADTAICPVRHAMRPSFFARQGGIGVNPATAGVDGRDRGLSGKLSGDQVSDGNHYALQVEDLNSRIHINGGALDALDRDPDGPPATAADFPLNPNAAAEVAPLSPNGIPDYRDPSMEGPNGFLVRLLNNLDAVVTNGATSNLGVQVVSNRPVGGYKSVEGLKGVLGQARYDTFKGFLTLTAWVDSNVVKAQPMDGRPFRFQDIDDAHRVGTPSSEISGVKTSGGGNLQLIAGISGSGTQADPWVQTITASNSYEGSKTYPVRWERNFVYARHQLRPAPPALEPRAPVSINRASREVLAAVLSGLRGTWLETWDGSAGWDGGFGWFARTEGTYLYPDISTEETPWHRTRLDLGMTYGTGSRPWYGPASYDPHAAPNPNGMGGKPLIQAAPLGRLRETEPLTREQALAIADQVQRRVSEAGPFRTWVQFNAFVDKLPRWEDINNDGVLDGAPYTVNGSGGTYTRRIYQREDLDSDGAMKRETFSVASGNWVSGVTWKDTASDPGGVRGLSFVQKDVLKAMANPNTDLNDFNPDSNLFKEVDKIDVAGLGSLSLSPGLWQANPDAYAHTTEFFLEESILVQVSSLGRVLSKDGRLLAQRQAGALVRLGELYRDTTQADFMKAFNPGGQSVSAVFSAPAAPYPLAGNQALLSYPEPQTIPIGIGIGFARAADAVYDGQISLGFIGPDPGPDETLRGALFCTTRAEDSADPAVPDLRGPVSKRLLGAAGFPTGSVFPDGVYSERDRALKYPIDTNLPAPKIADAMHADNAWNTQTTAGSFYLACWVKTDWCPEASPRPHALLSLSLGAEPRKYHRGGSFDPWNSYDMAFGYTPMDDILTKPVGLYFVPARNNAWQGAMGTYVHDATSTRGKTWPSRSLLWGTTHGLYASDCLHPGNTSSSPLGVERLEAHRWTHLLVSATVDIMTYPYQRLLIGRVPASADGGGWTRGFGPQVQGVGKTHLDGSENHLRFGEVAGLTNMNYPADATFANVRAGSKVWDWSPPGWDFIGPQLSWESFFFGAWNPGALGRYLKESGAAFTSAKLPAGIRPLRITWTEIPCDLWFDQDANGVLEVRDDDLDGNGKRDVRIDLEVWDDLGTVTTADDVRLAAFSDPAGENRIPVPTGRLYYKALFVNEWNATTRANFPLDVTPFLDDVTVSYALPAGPRILAWGDEE